jgi:CRISPR-associated protein Cmr1
MNTKLHYRVGFATPAFLGDATGHGTWRVPPFKALLRQWWRVVHAPVVNYDVTRLLADESRIFGAAAEKDAHRSLVQLRLGHWDDGKLTAANWPNKDIPGMQSGGNTVPADVYLGYGPVPPRSKQASEQRRAIAPADTNTLEVLLDRRLGERDREEITAAIELMDGFGTMGSRSRNGWGSLSIRSGSGSHAGVPDLAKVVSPVTRTLEECFRHDWPHAIGRDDLGPLVWVGARDGKPLGNWREAVWFLANLRRTARSAAAAKGGAGAITASQLFAYPVTKQQQPRWGGRERVPNSLRFKVIDCDGALHPVVYHMPADLPAALMGMLPPPDQKWVRENRIAIWKSVHEAVGKLMAPRGARA